MELEAREDYISLYSLVVKTLLAGKPGPGLVLVSLCSRAKLTIHLVGKIV